MRDLPRAALRLTPVLAFLALASVPWERLVATKIDLSAMLAGPSAAHPLGTDNMGRDLLVRLADALHGAVLPLWTAALLGSLFGLGLASVRCAATRRMFFILDALATLVVGTPLGLLVFAAAAVHERAGLGAILLPLSLVLALRSYQTLTGLYARDAKLGYWQAHELLGGSRFARFWRYGTCTAWRRELMLLLSFHLQIAVVTEASLSYLGFGVQEPQASFGNILAAHFDLYLRGDCGLLFAVLGALALTAAFPTLFLRLLEDAAAVCLRRAQGVTIEKDPNQLLAEIARSS